MSENIHAFESGTSVTSNDRDDTITDFVAGNLSPAKHALMSCVVALNSKAAQKAAFETQIAAAFMSDVSPVALSPLFMGEALAKLPPQDNAPVAANDPQIHRMAPKLLRDLMNGQGLRDVAWKFIVPGVAVHDVLESRRTKDRDRLYLFRTKAGMKMPEHSHQGEEWTLILSGSYVAEGQRYARGDLHIADEATHHAPKVDTGEDCICLVMTQGPLKMKRWAPKIVQQVVGI